MNSRLSLHRSRGFSMVELMVAMGIAVFLLGGMFTIMQGTRKSSDNERAIALLQDNERIAMTLISNVIEQAGYYSGGLTNALTTMLPASANFATAGQAVAGSTNAQGDVVTLRYQANQIDGVLNCQGANAATGLYENQFSIDANGNLVCAINGGAALTLVSGIQTMTVLYGVGSQATSANTLGAVDAYLTAAQMNANPMYWTNVYAIRISLTFKNPMVGQPGQAAAPAIVFTKVISIKSRTGVNVATYI